MSETQPRILRNDSGISNLGVLLVFLILVIGGYLGAQVFPYYYNYWELEGHFQEMAATASEHDDKHIRDFLEKEIRSKQLPVELKDLIVRRQNGKIKIELEYTEYLTIPLWDGSEYDLWEFDFHPKAEEEL